MYRHRTDLLSLITGLVLLGAAVVTIFDTGLDWTATRWLGPVILVLIGIALLFPVSRRMSQSEPIPDLGIDGSPLPPEALERAESELPPSLTD